MNNKQINRVVTPLKVDTNGQIISMKPGNKQGDEYTPELQIVSKEKKVSLNTILIGILAFIFVVLIALIVLLVIPDYKISADVENKYNDYEPIKSNNQSFKYSTTELSKEIYLKEEGKYKVTGLYELGVTNTGGIFKISINDKELFDTKNLLSKVAIIDNLLVLTAFDNNSYTIRMYDKNVNLIKTYENIGSQDKKIEKIEYKNNRILITESIVQGNFIKVDGEFYNICDISSYIEKGMDVNQVVTQIGEIVYSGSRSFNEYRYISITTLKNKKKEIC